MSPVDEDCGQSCSALFSMKCLFDARAILLSCNDMLCTRISLRS